MSSEGRRYLLVTPCRDEADHAQRTLDSVVAQSVQPAKWIIVDDGSTDGTPEILARAAAEHEWIQIVRREDRGKRSVGPGVIDAFYAGYEHAVPADYDFSCKFDLDLDIPPRYFEILMERMHADPRIGTCSGKAWFEKDGKLISEACGDEMSVGMTKFYRTECFGEIGGFVREVMWDGIDCHRCRMLGWRALSYSDEELKFIHLRPMGSSQQSLWTGRKRHGFGQWFMGTSFPYMFASAVFRMTRPPYIVGGFGMLVGYLGSALRRERRYEDKAFRRFLRRYQREGLLLGKAEATKRAEERHAHLKPTRGAERDAACA